MVTKELVREGLKNGAIDGDGHSIVAPEYFIERGFDLPKSLETTQWSGPGKYQIYDGLGKPVDKVVGVWTLDFHYWVAGECGLTSDDYGSYGGRGFQAQAIARALIKWVEEDDDEAAG